MPSISIVVPVRNEERHIESCLTGLIDQDYPPHRVEILVVDGRSDDRTHEVVRRVIDRNPDRVIRLVDNPRRIVPAGVNAGILAARNDIIVRMDGHTTPARDYLRSCVRALHETDADNVGGVIRHVADGAFGAAVAVAQAHPLGVGGAKYRYATLGQFVDTVPFGCFRRSLFEHVGLYDEDLAKNEDYELNVRIRKAGGRIYLDPRIRADYVPRSSPAALLAQYFSYGWWRVQTLRRHPDSVRPRQLVPPVFLGTLAILALFAGHPLVAQGLTALLVTYAGALLLASVVAFATRPSYGTLLAPLAFVIMHLAFGAGFLSNVLSAARFPFRNRTPRATAMERPLAKP